MAARHDDHLEALHSAVADAEPGLAADLVIALSGLWLFRESGSAALPWADTVLRLPGLGAADRARILVLRAALAHGPAWSAEEVLGPLADDPDWRCLALLVGSIDAYQRGDLDAAVGQAREVLELARTGARHHLPETLATLAAFEAAQGQTDAARAHVRDAAALIGPKPSAVETVPVVPKIALALLDLGEPAEPLRLLTSAADSMSEQLPPPPPRRSPSTPAGPPSPRRSSLAWNVRWPISPTPAPRRSWPPAGPCSRSRVCNLRR